MICFRVCSLLSLAVWAAASMTAPAAHAATSILVGDCVEGAQCWNTGASWSDTLTGAQLSDLGLGANAPLIAAQTAEYVIRLGETTMTFTTGGGPATETLGEFSGNINNDPCNFCEVATVGNFFIPVDATAAVISGTFGNSGDGSSAGVELFLGALPSPVPESSNMALLMGGLAIVGAGMRRRARNAP
jgi:hypothetical protein